MVEIVVYSTLACPYCVSAKNLLQAKGLEYIEIRVDKNDQHFLEMKNKSQKTSVPQIFISGKHVGGFTELKRLNDSGKLDELLS